MPSFGSGHYGIMEGYVCYAHNVELFASLPEEWRYPPDSERDYPVLVDYEEWPPVGKEAEDNGKEQNLISTL